MSSRDRRGAAAVLVVCAITVIVALCVRLMLSDGFEFVAGVLIGVPVGAMLGYLVDRVIPAVVDWYLDRFRRRGR